MEDGGSHMNSSECSDLWQLKESAGCVCVWRWDSTLWVLSFYFIFYLPVIPLRCKDILKKPSAWRPLESSHRLQGRNKPAFPGEGLEFGGEEWALCNSSSRRGGRNEIQLFKIVEETKVFIQTSANFYCYIHASWKVFYEDTLANLDHCTLPQCYSKEEVLCWLCINSRNIFVRVCCSGREVNAVKPGLKSIQTLSCFSCQMMKLLSGSACSLCMEYEEYAHSSKVHLNEIPQTPKLIHTKKKKNPSKTIKNAKTTLLLGRLQGAAEAISS
ncbi:hypothetical protein EK904_007462 [Melospiza melodia maxima]|nr:hypothetical protein EK904_007462 [Melospiza melodia maxima]